MQRLEILFRRAHKFRVKLRIFVWLSTEAKALASLTLEVGLFCCASQSAVVSLFAGWGVRYSDKSFFPSCHGEVFGGDPSLLGHSPE